MVKHLLTYVIGVLGALLVLSYLPNARATKTQRHVYVLSGGVGWNVNIYNQMIDELASAPRGTSIKIILKNNPGGAIVSLLPILKAMRDTQAVVITTVEGYASSAALDILLSGDMIIIPKKPIGIAHLSSNDKGNDFWLIPILQHLEHFMTPYEWYLFTHDGDVPIYGKTICTVAKYKVKDVPQYCILRGRMR